MNVLKTLGFEQEFENSGAMGHLLWLNYGLYDYGYFVIIITFVVAKLRII